MTMRQIAKWKSLVEAKNWIGDSRFSLSVNDYLIKGLDSSADFELSRKLMFHPDYTKYALVLQAKRNDKHIDSAILGFNVEDVVADCLQIQGGPGRYKELSPVRWDRALLDSLVVFSKESGLDAVCVLPARLVEGDPFKDPEGFFRRLEKRYDMNAKAHGFQYSDDIGRYVLEL